MRLLRRGPNGDLSFEEFLIEEDCPPYAILSHTWSEKQDEEVLYKDILSGHGKSKPGYAKIEFCADQSRKDSLEYFWIDTCCINKSDLPELSEAITSMFRWYQNASRCYVYLSDVSSRKRSRNGEQHEAWESSTLPPRWFTRGWTLQELVAPKRVDFFSREREYLGSRNTLAVAIEKATAIPIDVLSGQKSIYDCTFQERFRWVGQRQTFRQEDAAYCLLGLCDVSIVPSYGEGAAGAFRRLRREIEQEFNVDLEDVNPFQQYSRRHNLRRNGQNLAHSEQSLQARIMEICNSLNFDQMDSRRATIKSAYANTCAWLLRTPKYVSWLDSTKFHEHAGFLWIKGKPGAGKSTLLKFIHEQAVRARSNDEIIVSFFFNARGDLLEHSMLGMYQSLLYQLLTEAEESVHEFDRCTSQRLRAPGFRWSIELLSELLLSVVQRLQSQRLKFFIDALDECDEREVQDMVHNFENLSEKCQGRVSICFASRHYPTVNISDGLQLILENEAGHGEDIRKYIHKFLKFDGRQRLRDIKAEVERKANGVFLWVFLVIDILNEKFNKGQIELVRQTLDEIPTKLSDLFNNIICRDDVDKSSLLLSIQWILFAKRPLSHKEFFFAIKSGQFSEANPLKAWDPEIISEDDMKRFVQDCSKGLAELTRSKKSPTVQFIHESVKDFLIKEKGLCTLWPELMMDPESLSHYRLSKCAQRYLLIEWPAPLLLAAASVHEFVRDKVLLNETPYQRIVQMPMLTSHDPREDRLKRCEEVRSQLPFLQYVAENVFHHASIATRAVTAHDFLVSFDIQNWVFVMNSLERYRSRYRDPLLSLQDALIEFECYHLFKECFANSSSTLAVSSMCTALKKECWESFRVLLEYTNDQSVNDSVQRLKDDSAKSRFKSSDGQDLLGWALSMDNNRFAEMLVRFTNASLLGSHPRLYPELSCKLIGDLHVGFTKLCIDPCLGGLERFIYLKTLDLAAERGDAQFLRAFILKYRNHLPRWFPREILIGSSSRGDLEAMQLAISCGADVNAKDDERCTAILYALQGLITMNEKERALNAVKFLVSQWAEVNSSDNSYLISPFCVALEAGVPKDLVQLMLDKGADVHSRDAKGTTPLHHASMYVSTELTQLLLARGADINSQCENGMTALHLASRRGRQSMIKLLLESGAGINSRGTDGVTSLHLASQKNDPETLRLLMANGADIHSKNDEGLTALQLASRCGHEQAVQLLTACELESEGIVALEPVIRGLTIDLD